MFGSLSLSDMDTESAAWAKRCDIAYAVITRGPQQVPVHYTKDIFQEKVTAGHYYIGDYTYGTPNVLSWGEGTKLIIGKFCSISVNVTILLGGNHRHDWVTTYPFSDIKDVWPEAAQVTGHPHSNGDVIIGNDVWIGFNSTILSGITISDGAIVAANSVITKDVPPYAIVGGNPAKLIRYRFSEQFIAELMKIRWWDWCEDDVRQNLLLLTSNALASFITRSNQRKQQESLVDPRKVMELSNNKADLDNDIHHNPIPNLDAILSSELDVNHYRNLHPDLSDKSDTQLIEHYQKTGQNEGRWASHDQLSWHFISKLRNVIPALEIGPFNNPSLSGPGVSFFDILDKEGLQERARRLGMREDSIPRIDFVSHDADLSIVKSSFNLVFSSYVFEHQPDPIRHLKQVWRILETGAYYALIIPDCRYCFDHFLKPSNIGDIIQAHEELRTRHTIKSIIENRALTTHNDAIRHWQGDHGETLLDPVKVTNAIDEWRAAPTKYIDSHGWQYTPASFSEIIYYLDQMKIIRFDAIRVYQTPLNRQEFCVVLRRKE